MFRNIFLNWGVSSAGRAPRLQRGGQGFKSPTLHQFNNKEISMSDIEKEVYAKRGYILAKHYNKKLSQLYYFLKYRYYKRKNEKNFLKK